MLIFDVRLYWNPSTYYVDGACGVMEAAKDWGLSEGDVANAFREVITGLCRLPIENMTSPR